MVKQIVPMVEMKIQDFVVRKESFEKENISIRILLARYTCRPTEYRCLSSECILYIERCDRKIGNEKIIS